MENKQTAVEWLVLYMETYFHLTDESRQAFEKARKMEKEQIIKAYNSAIPFHFGEQYYNETYANDTTKGLPKENSKRRAWHY